MTKREAKIATVGRVMHNGKKCSCVILNESVVADTVQVRIINSNEYVIVKISEISEFNC